MRFIPIAQQLGMVKRHETVQISDALSVTYIHDPAKVSRFPRCALEHRKEMYSVQTGHKWAWEAAYHGVLYGHDEISVLIHLSKDYLVQIEDYRRHLVSTVGEEEIVSCETFRKRVAQHMPDWLREIINAKRPSDEEYERKVTWEMHKLFRDMGLRKSQRVKSRDGDPSGDLEGFIEKPREEPGDPDPGPGPGPVDHPQEVGEGENRSRERDDTYPVPKIEWLESKNEIEKHELDGKAGRFVEGAGVFFVNRQYQAIQEMYDLLVDEYAARTSLSASSLIDAAVRRVFHSRLYQYLAIALKHRQDGDCSSEVFEYAMSPSVLSLQADMALLHGGKNIRHARDSLKKRLQKAAA